MGIEIKNSIQNKNEILKAVHPDIPQKKKENYSWKKFSKDLEF
jgi:hypothetical protein